MVIYPVFTKWKTRRALLRGALLAGAVWLALFGLEQKVPAESWPGWLGTGDWGRCVAAGLVAFPTGLIDYGYRNRDDRAPWHLVVFLLVAAWLSLLIVFFAPHTQGLLQQLSSPREAGQQALRLLRVGGPCCIPAALVFALFTRSRWQRATFSSYFKVPLGVAVAGGLVGGIAARVTETATVPPFLILVTAPLLFALLLPVLGLLVDRVDGWVFALPDDPTIAGGEEEPATVEAGRKTWETDSAERVFSWNRPKPELEEAQPEEPATAEPKGELDALADDLFSE